MKFLTEWLHKKLNAGQDTAAADTATAEEAAGEADTDQDTAADAPAEPGQDTAGDDTGTDTAAGDSGEEDDQDDTAKGEADTAPEDGQDTAADEAAEPGPDTAGQEDTGTDTAAEEGEEPPAPEQNTAASADRSEFQRMVQAFGAEFAGVCFAKGMDYDAAMALHYEGMKAENAELRKRLAAVGSYGEEGPASNAQPADDGERDQFNRDCAANEERMSKGAAALAAHNRRALQQTK